MRTLALVPLATLALLLCGVAPAGAATAETVLREYTEDGETYYLHDVVYTAAAGEANRLTIAIDGRDDSIVLEDPGAHITVEGACTSTGPHRAVCAAPTGSDLARVEADLGDGHDTGRLDATEPTYSLSPQLAGGPGDDVLDGGPLTEYLLGGPGDDTIDGGPGGDQIDGGGGRDTMRAGSGLGFDFMEDGDSDASPDADVYVGGIVSYRSRTEPVVVDLDDGIGGAAGENDSFSGIHHVQGGTAGDTLLGSAGSDFLRGDAGDDRIEGRGGDDAIVGGDGADLLHGGSGDDLFHGGSDDARDVAGCGAGGDFVGASDARDLLRRSCEDAGWASAPMSEVHHSMANRITVQPALRKRGRRAVFRSSCVYGLTDCTGTIELRTPGKRRLLGRRRFTLPLERGNSEEPDPREAIRVRLNERGQRRIARGGRVRVVIRSRRDCGGCLNRPPRVSTGFTAYMSE